MKLAICARSEGLEAEVDQRFGRCPYFVIVDTESKKVLQSVANEGVSAAGGAGPQAAQMLAKLGVEAVVLGNVGPKAITALEAAKIKVYSGVEGTVENTLGKYNDNVLTLVNDATVQSHSGLNE